MDWEPDPGYQAPRFYVAYTWPRRRVYGEVVLYEQTQYGADNDYMYEIHDVKYVGEGGGPIKRHRLLSSRRIIAVNRLDTSSG